MSVEVQILLALLIDAVAGDPRWLPHPVRLIGKLAVRTELFCRKIMPRERGAGIATVFIVLSVACFCGWGIIRLANIFHPLLGDAASVFLLYTCFAARDLFDHSRRVADALHNGTLEEARKQVGMMVGRDTAELDEDGVVRACVESVAENTVDGVIAPLFWAVVGGPIGGLGYKTVNTMDSLFGYTSDRYLRFGWAPAKFDDLVNWLPARLTGVAMIVAAFFLRLRPADAWRIFHRDRLNHASPNSGHAEAAAAGALGIQLGGTSFYSGNPVRKPFIGDRASQPGIKHIHQANVLLSAVTILMTIMLLSFRIGFGSYFP